jgi:hypothetical protein
LTGESKQRKQEKTKRKKTKMGNLKLTTVRLSFADLRKPKAFPGDPNNKPRYGGTFLIPKNDPQVAVVRALIESVSMEKWPTNYVTVLNQLAMENRICFKDGDLNLSDDGQVKEGYAGVQSLRASCAEDTPPILLGADERVLSALDFQNAAVDYPYSGCFVHCIVNIWAMQNEYGKRINASLEGVMFAAPGDRFGAERADASSFAGMGTAVPLQPPAGMAPPQPQYAPQPQPPLQPQPAPQPAPQPQYVPNPVGPVPAPPQQEAPPVDGPIPPQSGRNW